MSEAWNKYDIPTTFDPKLMIRFYGVEIMRRVIGLAQLPLTMTLSERQQILGQAAQCVTKPDEQLVFS
jgi:5-methylthioribose kinase